MTPQPMAQPQMIAAPVRYNGQFACPRCRGRLVFDGDELLCVACGYEYDPMSAVAPMGAALRAA